MKSVVAMKNTWVPQTTGLIQGPLQNNGSNTRAEVHVFHIRTTYFMYFDIHYIVYITRLVYILKVYTMCHFCTSQGWFCTWQNSLCHRRFPYDCIMYLGEQKGSAWLQLTSLTSTASLVCKMCSQSWLL